MKLEELMAAMQQTASTPPRAVEVPGWGKVYVREVTVGEIEDQTQDTDRANDKRRIARGAARVICDEKGKPLFDPNNEAHIDLIAKQPWRLLRKVIETSEQDAKNG